MEGTAIPKFNAAGEFYENFCACSGCWSGDYSCDQNVRVMEHSAKVNLLILACPDIVTLIVGPERVIITCHKTLLCFTSEYFDAILSGGWSTNMVNLEVDELPEAVSTFVAWAYTGRIAASCKLPPEVLWVLGDRLRIPGFTNEAMHYVFARYCIGSSQGWESLDAKTADYIYANTTSGSKLRKYIVDLVLAYGPLGPDSGLGQDGMQKWKDLILRKGDLVADVALRGSFFGEKVENSPSASDRHHLYLEAITTRPVEDIVEGKPRTGTRASKATR